MPYITANGLSFYYEEQGKGPPLILGHSLTLDGQMYAAALPLLAREHRVINIDLRGHGRSAKPDVPFSLEDMAEDVYQLMQALKLEDAFYAGLSMGGMIGMRLAIQHPESVRALVLMDTSAKEEPRRKEYEEIAENLKQMGPSEPVADFVLQLLLSEQFRKEHPELTQQIKQKLLNADITGQYWSSMAVIRRKSVLELLKNVHIPALVIVGDKDIATPIEEAKAIAEALPNAELQVIPNAGHLTILEQPEPVSELITAFLQKHY